MTNWKLTEGLIVAHFIGLFVTMTAGLEAAFTVLGFQPGRVLAKPWSVVTYQFVRADFLFFIFAMIVLWLFARTLENDWGSPRFLVFWLISTFGAVGAAVVVGIPLAGDIFMSASLLFTYATLYPDTELRLFLLVPVKVKYLAVVAGAFLVYSSLQLGWVIGAVNLAGTSAGYLFFLATRNLPSRRTLAYEFKKRRSAAVSKVESAAAEHRNRAWDPRVRAAEARARDSGEVAAEDEALLAELDRSVDPSVTVCAPSEFGYTDDDVCRGCPGFAECAARRIRMAAEEQGEAD